MLHSSVWYACQTLLAMLLPTFCSYCRTLLSDAAVFCGPCFNLIRPITSKTIAITSKHKLTVFAVSPYQTPLKELILAKSYRNEHASRQLAKLMVAMTPINTLAIDYVIPIPLHWTRQWWRGYNQAKIIAEIIAHAKNTPLLNILTRHKKTPFLSSLQSDERAVMMLDAMSVKLDKSQSNFLEGKSILLVDDLLTTGSTLQAAAKALLAYKPASITAVVACRTL